MSFNLLLNFTSYEEDSREHVPCRERKDVGFSHFPNYLSPQVSELFLLCERLVMTPELFSYGVLTCF